MPAVSRSTLNVPALVASAWLLSCSVPAARAASSLEHAAEAGGKTPCEVQPALPALPPNYRLVTDFGALPDDSNDDTDALDAALDASAGSFLVFPPGKYLISRSLRVKQSGVTLWGPGAEIHATNVDDQSIVVESDDTSIYSFTLTAVTDVRRSRVEDTRISIYGPAGVHPIVKNTIIQDNSILESGPPGTSLANSASGAGIFVNAADGFVIAGNTVSRSLADGIHMTGGARNGRVIGNVVRQTGDDMIAMVSYAYADPYHDLASQLEPNFAQSLATYQDANILVAGNRVSGQYWGRGISVVGGRDITIRDNTLDNLPYGAAIYLARETQSGTFGLDNIVVRHNAISNEQTEDPPYNFDGKFSENARTGHGAVEIEGSMFVDELVYPDMVAGFGLSNIAIVTDSVTTSATPGVRIGVGTGSNWQMGSRAVTGNTLIAGVTLQRDALAAIWNPLAIQNFSDSNDTSCRAITLDGVPFESIACTAPLPPALPTGAKLSCPRR